MKNSSSSWRKRLLTVAPSLLLLGIVLNPISVEAVAAGPNLQVRGPTTTVNVSSAKTSKTTVKSTKSQVKSATTVKSSAKTSSTKKSTSKPSPTSKPKLGVVNIPIGKPSSNGPAAQGLSLQQIEAQQSAYTQRVVDACQFPNGITRRNFLVSLTDSCIGVPVAADAGPSPALLSSQNAHVRLVQQNSTVDKQFRIEGWLGYTVSFSNAQQCVDYFLNDQKGFPDCIADEVVKGQVFFEDVKPTAKKAKANVGPRASNVTAQWLTDYSTQTSIPGLPTLNVTPIAFAKQVPWQLDLIDQRNPTNPSGTFTYPSIGGGGIDIYIVDTGIDVNHVDLKPRAVWGTNTADDINQDLNGHGTNMASDAGGTYCGPAKKAKLIAVKVLSGVDSAGSIADLVAGLQWIGSQLAKNGRARKSVVNISLGTNDIYKSLDAAVLALANMGVPISISGGNQGLDACLLSPTATAPLSKNIIAVGGTQNANGQVGDPLLWFDSGNYGTCITLLAPAVLSYDDNTGLVTANPSPAQNWLTVDDQAGTSGSAAMVSGVIALQLSNQQLNLATTNPKDYLTGVATKNVVSNMPDDVTPNLFLYLPQKAIPPPSPPPPPPPANKCNGQAVGASWCTYNGARFFERCTSKGIDKVYCSGNACCSGTVLSNSRTNGGKPFAQCVYPSPPSPPPSPPSPPPPPPPPSYPGFCDGHAVGDLWCDDATGGFWQCSDSNKYLMPCPVNTRCSGWGSGVQCL